MNALQSKVVSIIALGLSSVLVGLLPAWFSKQGRRQWPLFLSSLLCFGGGVLLSTSLIHILPELREAAPKEFKKYSEMVFCAGFFILYLVDEIVHYFYGDSHVETVLHHLENNSHSCSERRHSAIPNYTQGATEKQHLLGGKELPRTNHRFYRTRSDSVLFFDDPPSQLCHVGHQEPCHATPTANIGLLTALSVHSLLEGLVVGLEGIPGKVLLLLGAIASHKLVVGFCLGVELASNSAITIYRHVVYILIFSLGSVVGIAIGMFITNIPNEFQNLMIPVLQALAGGTLLYVTVSEVLPRERARWHQQHGKRSAGMIQFLSVGLGFFFMTTLSKCLAQEEV